MTFFAVCPPPFATAAAACGDFFSVVFFFFLFLFLFLPILLQNVYSGVVVYVVCVSFAGPTMR